MISTQRAETTPSPDRERLEDERRAARREGKRRSRLTHETMYRRVTRMAKTDELKSLLEEVLRVEPWNPHHYYGKIGATWAMCGKKIHGYWHKKERKCLHSFVRGQVYRMVKTLDSPKEGTWWKSNPDVVNLTRTIAAELELNKHRMATITGCQRELGRPEETDGGVKHGGAVDDIDDVTAQGGNPVGARGDDGREN